MLIHHNWWSACYKCCAALCQKWGSLPAEPQFWKSGKSGTPNKKEAVSGGKTPKKLSKKILRLRDAYKKYILQKNWVKTAIPALGSGQSNLQTPIWGRHRQLDDQYRNPNINDKDHLVGQFTKPTPATLSQHLITFFTRLAIALILSSTLAHNLLCAVLPNTLNQGLDIFQEEKASVLLLSDFDPPPPEQRQPGPFLPHLPSLSNLSCSSQHPYFLFAGSWWTHIVGREN